MFPLTVASNKSKELLEMSWVIQTKEFHYKGAKTGVCIESGSKIEMTLLRGSN